MAENFEIAEGGKSEKYPLLLKQIELLVEVEKDPVAVMANASSMIHHTFGFLWTGFYVVKENMLVVGPFQGPVACNRIHFGKGVCGTSWKERTTIVVSDVTQFPSHIACSSESKSEIVVPIVKDKNVLAVLDIDSAQTGTFDQTDAYWLERIAGYISSVFCE